MSDPLVLEVRRFIPASAERLFDAWTDAAQLQAWWGPQGVRGVDVHCDARVGGRYQIGNELPDGRLVMIHGEFVSIVRPRELVFTWTSDAGREVPELVTVRFEPKAGGTEVVVTHERIAEARIRDQHEAGWTGCLDGLMGFVAGAE